MPNLLSKMYAFMLEHQIAYVPKVSKRRDIPQ